MANFDELLALLRDPGEDGTPETIYDDLYESYANTAGIADGANVRVTELEGALAAADEQISALKSHNYDLLMAVETNSDTGTIDEAESEVAEDNESIDDLFTDEDDN